MRKRRIGQPTEIDDICPLLRIVQGPLKDRLHTHRRRIDNLGEDLDVVFGHVRGFPGAAEIGRNIFQLIGPAYDRHAIARAQPVEIGTAAAGQHDLVRLARLGQAPQDDVLGHQGRHLHADIDHLPVETRVHAAEHGLKPWPRQMSGQE